MNRLAQLSEIGTSIWVDAVMTGDDLAELVREKRVTGLTSNPTILERSISAHDREDDLETFVVAQMRELADVLRPVYDATNGVDGYVSVEVAPDLANDTDRTVAAARELWGRLGRPNAMIKIPATHSGVHALRRLVADGINVNATLLFSLETYDAVARAYIDGLKQRLDAGLAIGKVASVASFFVSRVDSAIDPILREQGREQLAGRSAVANARIAYATAGELFGGARFSRLAEACARPQRLLWASTGTKDGRYSDVKYVDELAGPGVVNTMPLATLYAFEEHGDPTDRLSGRALDALAVLAELYHAGIDIDAVSDSLLADGIARFAASYAALAARGEVVAANS